MGTHILAATTSSSHSSSSLILIVVVFAIFMIFMFRSQRRRTRATQDTQRAVVTGSRVRTVHGIYGTVIDGDDRNVLLEIAPGVQIKMLRQAIGVVVPDDEPDGINHTVPDFDADETINGDDSFSTDSATADDTDETPGDDKVKTDSAAS